MGKDMEALILIPTIMRLLTGGYSKVTCHGKTVGQVIDSLEKAHPGLKEKILDETGNLRGFVNIYLNGKDINFLQNLDTPVTNGDNIALVPVIAGG